MPLDELKAYMKLMVFRDFTNEGSSLINDLKDYLNDRAVIEHYITPQLKAEVQNMCEEVRQVFIQRIGSLQWMSSSTKARAIKKIERIKFFVGYPDKWMASSPDLSGCANAREALQTFYKANLQYQKAYLGMKAADDYFNYQFGSVSASLLSANCYYDLQDNVVSIYPPYMLPPYYEAGMHPAIKYGMLMAAIGHEITHSVDIDGSKFDENGEITTWWTVQDKMDYEKLQQQLIDLYNRLPVLPEFDPSICTNGEKTLGENIADLGGLEIAHDAFVNYCKNRGFKGKDLDEMERKFFQAYANSCRSKYGSDYYEELKDDEHAFNKERVNGVVMNVDRWYELYNVQWGHYLYLRPENRTHIW
jgi:predicted metalloendopeptidase